MNLRRLAVPVMGTILVFAAATILWTLAYAATTALAFRDTALLKTVTQTDPTASARHLLFYWSDARVPRNGLIAAAVTTCLLGGLIIATLFIRKPATFGDARFATSGDILKTNLNARDGLILGRHGGNLIRHNEAGHILVEGPTRSGKGQGFVEPNGLTWTGSLICLDPKQENFRSFGATRVAQGNEVFLFAPGSTRSHAYNPLDFVRLGPELSTDLANLAAFLIPEPRGEGAFWASSARNLFSAALGYVLQTPLCEGRRDIRCVLTLLSTGSDIANMLTVICKTERTHLSPFIVDQFNQFIPMPEKTRGSIVSHLIDALKPWNNPLIAAVTAKSDFNIRELRDKPISIFIGAPVADLESFRPLVRVLVQQIHEQLMRELPQTDDALPILMLLDEFPTLQRMETIVAKLPVSAGYGIRMAIVVQAISQLDEIYGRATRDTILANTDLKLFVGTNDQTTAEYISETLGTRTAIAKTVSGARSQNPFAPRNTTRSEVATRLMRPEQVRELDRRKAILLVRGERPILLDKIISHKDRMFRKLKHRGRGVLLSVPQLKPDMRRISPFSGLSVEKEHQPTPKLNQPQHEARQTELPLRPSNLVPADTIVLQNNADHHAADLPVKVMASVRHINVGDCEDAVQRFVRVAIDQMPTERAGKLETATNGFLVLSRKFRPATLV
jgi:type IV secretion system protein VirD4